MKLFRARRLGSWASDSEFSNGPDRTFASLLDAAMRLTHCRHSCIAQQILHIHGQVADFATVQHRSKMMLLALTVQLLYAGSIFELKQSM